MKLSEQLKDMPAEEFAHRLANCEATNKQKQELTKLWYSLNRRKNEKSKNEVTRED